LLQRSAHN